ncbi:MAG: hypothetical protein COB30_019210 [Ectothiorhodospiraceae bacterium]|nr:hypothetical protein [Ectothiorhodospiraceae bacterium]
MKATQLVLRCYAENKSEQWHAVCLDLNLAAQGDSFDEVESKLREMIAEYVFDALVGEDKGHAAYFMNRKAPASMWLKYYLHCALFRVLSLTDGVYRLFDETLPLTPYSNCR